MLFNINGKCIKVKKNFKRKTEIYALTFPKKCVYFNLVLCIRKSKAKMPIQDITIGQFAPKNSIIHHLDPRTKMVLSLLLMVVLFSFKSVLFLVLFFVIMCLIFVIAKLSPLIALRNLRPFLWLLGLTLLLHAFFTEGNIILWQLPQTGIRMSKEGLFQGLYYTLRIADLTILAGLYTLTTSPMSFADSVEKILSPLKPVGVPAHEIAMMMSISLRFIPILIEETERIQHAQMSRGAGFRGHPIQKIRGVVPILIPLFVSSFHRANDLALAMDSRCYRGGKNRTSFKMLKMTRRDWFAIGWGFVFGIVFFLMERCHS